MRKVVIHDVDVIKNIDMTRYTDGTMFNAPDNIYIVHRGALKPLLPKTRQPKKKAVDK